MERKVNLPQIRFLGTDEVSPRSQELMLGQEKLWAFSKGAHFTYFIFKKNKIAFDLGFCPMEAVPCTDIFITHAHEDHSCGLLRHIQYRKLFNLPPATYYFPSDLVEPLREVLRAWNRFNQRDSLNLPHVVGLNPGDTVALNRNMEISAFKTHHRGPSLGFHWFNPQKNPETPFFSYLGDHTAQSLKETPLLGSSQNLAIELTFIEEEKDKAETYQHMYLDGFIEMLDRGYFKNERVILKHLSSRYSTHRIKEVLRPVLAGRNLPDIIVI